MRPTRTVWLIALTAAAACTEAPIGPASDEDDGVATIVGDATLDNFLNNPDAGGPRIVRGESGPFLLLFDDTPGSSLVAVHSAFPVCGGTLALAAFHEIDHNPDDPFTDRIQGILQWRDVNIWILDLANPGPCFGFELVAGGTGRIQFTDNDVFPTLWGGSNANAFGYTAHATLTTPTGARARYSGMQRTSWKLDADDNVVFDHVTEKLNLKIQ
jgi:hypothetical protein